MALEIFKLVGSVFVDTDKANDSLQKVDKNASKVAEGFGKAGKVAAGVGAAIGTAIVGAGVAINNMANDASEAADEIDKMSQKIGLSTESYQEWDYIMGQNGMDISKLETGMKTLVTQMDKVQSGNASAIDTFKSLGVEVMNADGSLRSQEEVMEDTVLALAEMGDTAERARLQTELFGKAGTEMSPMLNQGAEAIEDLKNRSHELGLIMSDDAIQAGVTYGDLQDDLKKAGDAIKNSIGAAVLPLLSKLAEKIIEFMPQISKLAERIGPLAADFVDKLLPPMISLAEEILPVLMDAAAELLPSLSEIANEIIPVVVDLAKELLPVIVQVVGDVLPVAVEIIKKLTPILSQLMEFLGPILEMVLQLVSPLLELVMQILTPILDLVTQLLGPVLTLLTDVLTPIFGIIQAILEPLTSLLGAILEPIAKLLGILLEPLVQLLDLILPPLATMIENFFEWASPVLTQAFEFLGKFFNFIVDKLGAMQKSFGSFKDFFKNLWSGITDIFKSAINFIIKGINVFIEGLNKIQPPEWITNLTGITGVNLKTIPMLAEGGNIEAAGRVIVGERGPEMLDLPRGARVTPLDGAVGLDYDKLTQAFVTALRLVAPDLAANVRVEGNRDNLVRVLVDENRRSIKMTGGGLFE